MDRIVETKKQNRREQIIDHLEDIRHKEYLELIARAIIEKFAPKRVLDVGCGRGDLVAIFKNWGIEAYGIDALDPSITKSFREDIKDRVFVADAEALPFKEESFDLVIAHHVIEHLHNPEQFILEARRVLKRGGTVFIVTTISPLGLTKLWRILRLQKEPTHISLHARSFWEKTFEKLGFQFVSDFDELLKKDPPSYSWGKLLMKLGPIGKVVWLRIVGYIRGSFLFKRID